MPSGPAMNETYLGDTTVRLLVPSRRQDGGVVSSELRAEWESRSRSRLETLFGGATPTTVIGAFQHHDGRCTREQIVVLSAACSRETLLAEKKRQEVLTFAGEMCAALGQESIFVGWGDQSYVVSEAFDPNEVPVIRFLSLPPATQIPHLTMGWAGIDASTKVLQVLSLDGWTLPSDDESRKFSQGAWTLCGVLHDAGNIRRAWAWSGDIAGLKAEFTRKTIAGPASGDLVFLAGKPHYLNFALVTDKRLAGPRDLRLSHGQLNPVTRNLLLRILRREWNELELDLRRKPLDQRFFPQLQRLRSAVENELRNQLPSTASAGGGPKKRTKKQAPSTPSGSSPTLSAFRESVLIVGRMMFLRFLIQKQWIPGGMDWLKQEFNRRRDAFFSDSIIPLWFDVLNRPESERTPDVAKAHFGGFPYLNGGLFMPRPGERDLRLPAKLFDPQAEGSFLRLFEEFEFSLNEHAGTDDSLKIDPSFFGKALESFNPDDEKKSQGVHYTPKPIAWALAAEAITTRVAAISGYASEVIAGLLTGDLTTRRSLTGRQADQIRKILADLRIIDPAVGSGVLLWASLEVLLALDSACAGILNGGDGYQRGSFEWGQRSRHFVCNCLYGVDISDEAVELSRLRLWLAVALSEDVAAPLPDLDLSICRGDSLAPNALVPAGARTTGGGDVQLMLPLDECERLQNDLRRLTREYLRAGLAEPGEQRSLMAEIHGLRRTLALADKQAGQEPSLNWDLYFPHVFGDASKQGFDVVIANPPYIRVQKIDKTMAAAYRSTWPTIASGNADLCFAFIELALRKLASPNGGQIAFIQPNFRHHDAAERLRSFLTGRDHEIPVSLRLWVDFGDTQVFPTASNYVALLFAERGRHDVKKTSFTYSTPDADVLSDEDRVVNFAWMRPAGATNENPLGGEWLTVERGLRDRVKRHAEAALCRLGDIATIEVGIQTSADDVFLFAGGRPVDETLIEVDVQDAGTSIVIEAGLLRRCVKGSAGNDFFLLFPYDQSGTLYPREDLERRFPRGWAYLKKHKARLEGRESGGFKGPTWYRFGRNQGCEACCVPKVIVPAALSEPVAIRDQKGLMAFTASGKGGGGAWAVRPKPGTGATLKQLADVLTRDATWDHFLAYGSPQKGGWRGVDKAVLAALPVLRSES
jgi:hypothetical protein